MGTPVSPVPPSFSRTLRKGWVTETIESQEVEEVWSPKHMLGAFVFSVEGAPQANDQLPPYGFTPNCQNRNE